LIVSYQVDEIVAITVAFFQICAVEGKKTGNSLDRIGGGR